MDAVGRDGDAPLVPRSARVAATPGWRDAAGGQGDALTAALRAGTWAPGGRYAKVERGDFVFLGSLVTAESARSVVLKRFVRRAGVMGGVREVFSAARSRRQCIGARRLAELGIGVARPLLLLRGKMNGEAYDWLLMERLAGEDLIHALARGGLGVREERSAAEAAGALVRRIDEGGLFNRDHKLSNLILGPDGAIGVVDTVGVQRRPGNLDRMLAAMMYEAMGTGLLPRRSVLWRCVRAAAPEDSKRMWRRLAGMAREAGDTRPRVNPMPAR